MTATNDRLILTRTSLAQAIVTRLPWIALLLLPLAAAAWSPVPGDHEIPFCTLRRITGIPCLTCGFTRALIRCVHGAWLQALRSCPLGVLPPALLLAGVSHHLAALLLRVRLKWQGPTLTRARGGAIFVTLALLALANWLYQIL